MTDSQHAADNTPAAPKPAKPVTKPVSQPGWKPLGAVRDYLTVQMEQDAFWDNYRPGN